MNACLAAAHVNNKVEWALVTVKKVGSLESIAGSR